MSFRIFPHNEARGAEITEADEARNRSMLIRSRVERTMRAEIEANAVSYPALLSIARERERIYLNRKVKIV